MAYGSLISEPGDALNSHIIARIPQTTPWPIEYARSSKSRGGGPTLVIHPRGEPVKGLVFVLNLKHMGIEVARELLRKRERTVAKYIKKVACAGLNDVLYADLPANIPDADLKPRHLAQLAIKSVVPKSERNGIRYLADNIKQGIATPLTEAYASAILSMMKADDLDVADRIAKVRARNRGRLLSWRKAVWLVLATTIFWFSGTRAVKNTGSLHVEVTTQDKIAKPIPGALLILMNEKDGYASVEHTDLRGRFNWEVVQAGPYRLTVEAGGFHPRHHDILVTTSADVVVDGTSVNSVNTEMMRLTAPNKAGNPMWRDATGRGHTDEELSEIIEKHSTWVASMGKEGSPADLSGAQFSTTKVAHIGGIGYFHSTEGYNFRDSLLGKFLRKANLKGAHLANADLSFANLDEADLRGADLSGALLTHASLRDTELKDAELDGAHLGGALFEPKSNPKIRGTAGTKFLQFARYEQNPDALSQIRKQFEENGFREQERSVIYAMRQSEAQKQLFRARFSWDSCFGKGRFLEPNRAFEEDEGEKGSKQLSILTRLFSNECHIADSLDNFSTHWLNTVLFDWTCQYGMNPVRPLQLILVCWLGLALVYPLSMDRSNAHSRYRPASGVYLVRKRNWSEHAPLQQIRFAARPIRTQHRWRSVTKLLGREFRLFEISLCFSLLSAFNIGFRDANVGAWLRMLTRREYELKAVGWVRAISGFQSLFCLYLFALWVLIFFGRPFA